MIVAGEVAVALSSYPGVKEANVYGVAVPHAEGRGGMALLVVDHEFDIAGLAAHLDRCRDEVLRELRLLRTGDS